MINKRVGMALLASSLVALTACISDITSSTSSTLDAVTPDITLNHFVDVRIASIQKEAAAGEGENLMALAHLMGQQDKAAFSGWMQTHYSELFTDLKQPSELVMRIEKISTQFQI